LEPLTIAVLDIDHFKAYNDTHGHPAGDQVLREFAARARTVLRRGDVLARWGGEEFALALPRCGSPDASTVLAGLSEVMPHGLTFSAGHTTMAAPTPCSTPPSTVAATASSPTPEPAHRTGRQAASTLTPSWSATFSVEVSLSKRWDDEASMSPSDSWPGPADAIAAYSGSGHRRSGSVLVASALTYHATVVDLGASLPPPSTPSDITTLLADGGDHPRRSGRDPVAHTLRTAITTTSGLPEAVG
jgi:GGDEF domain-containing protein